MVNTNDRVFCSKCKWCLDMVKAICICTAPENKTKKWSWYSEWNHYIGDPRDINRDNNCEWYMKKRK